MSLTALFTGMQAVATALLTSAPDTCNILRLPDPQAPNAYGYAQGLFGQVNSQPVPCLYEALTGEERDEQGAVTGVSGYRITLPAGTDVTERDRLVTLARGTEPQRTFEIIAPPAHHAGVTLTLMAKLVS